MIHKIIKDLLKNIKDPIIFEIGARAAEDSVQLFHNNVQDNNGRLYSFEPILEHYNKLEASIDNDRFKAINKAVSDKMGNAVFYVSKDPENFNGSSSLKKPTGHLTAFTHVSFPTTIDVQTISLDGFCNENNIDHIDLLWADCQGAFGDIVKGAQNILKNTRYIYTETYNSFEMYENEMLITDWLKLLPFAYQLVKAGNTDVMIKNLEKY